MNQIANGKFVENSEQSRDRVREREIESEKGQSRDRVKERDRERKKNTTDSKRIEEVKNIHKNCQRRGKQLEFAPIKLMAKKCASTKTVQLYLLSTLIDS